MTQYPKAFILWLFVNCMYFRIQSDVFNVPQLGWRASKHGL